MDRISQIQSRIQEIESRFKTQQSAPQQSGGEFSEILAKINSGDFTRIDGSNIISGMPQLNLANLSVLSEARSSQIGHQICSMAEKFAGRQYWPNACAHAVNDVLKAVGIDITKNTNNNPDWVPNYANVGQKITNKEELRPGDLVIYNNEIGQGGYDHIGIYAGNGMAYNVSTANGYKFVLTPIGDRFQEGRRLG